ncbi:hypothetical protein BGX26_011894 [Mortierella sp. AD094]|nr:hypothetical protein BGX26_011894 [Mortierella sp. AD094]
MHLVESWYGDCSDGATRPAESESVIGFALQFIRSMMMPRALVDSFRAHGTVKVCVWEKVWRKTRGRDIEKIPVEHVDGKKVLYWEDIDIVFPGVKRLKNGEVTINLMRDSSGFRIVPHRIKHYPGVVLDVVLPNTVGHAHVDSPKAIPSVALTDDQTDAPTNASTNPYCPGAVNDMIHFSPPSSLLAKGSEKSSLATVVESVSELAIAAKPSSDLSLSEPLHVGPIRTSTMQIQEDMKVMTEVMIARNRAGKPLDAHCVVEDILPAEYRRSMVPHVTAMPGLDTVMVMRKLEAMDEKLNRTDQNMQENLKLSKQMNDRLILIQGKTEAILTQQLELTEYSIPRLFIVLPEEQAKYDPGNWFRTKFRLYFICECGEHTQASKSNEQHHLHLAKHEGYLIREPTAFFKKYGPFLLLMLELIKCGTNIAGHVVPALASLKVVELVDSVQQTIESVTTRINYSLECIDNQLTKAEALSPGNFITTVQPQAVLTQSALANYLNNVEGLEGVELRQLGSFLKTSEENNLLGNMYRMTTKEGHVKWVCRHHYKAAYEEALTQKLRDIITLSGGKYDEHLGRIEIVLSSSFVDSEFYDAVSKSKGVIDLNIKLYQSQEYPNFVRLKDMVSKSNIRLIKLIFHRETGSQVDIALPESQRYDPLFEIMQLPRIQSFEVMDVPRDVFKQPSPLPRNADLTNLRHLRIDPVDFSDMDISMLELLVDQAPNLSTLLLETSPAWSPAVLRPVPRLFIILLETPTSRDPMTTLFSRFRLHFICECGEHTKSAEDTKASRSKIPHHLHLTDHRGYLVNRPTEFLEKYGHFLILMLEMLKVGASVAGVVVPALSSLKLVDIVGPVQSTMDTVTSKVIEDVDYTLKYLKASLPDGDARPSQQDLANYLAGVEEFEGVDLPQLGSYLPSNNSDNLFGNLFCTITKKGQFKWVCRDHYYAITPSQKLHKMVKQAGGKFDEQLGRIEMTLCSSSSALKFYDAISNASNVFDLDVSLYWNQEQADLVKLKDMISSSNIRSIKVNLHHETGPKVDNILHGSRRYDPLFEIMRLPSIQSFEVVNVPGDFFKRSSPLPINYDLSSLRRLGIDQGDLKDADIVKLKLLVAQAPNLSSLMLTTATKLLQECIHLISDYRTRPIIFRNLSLCFVAKKAKEQREQMKASGIGLLQHD